MDNISNIDLTKNPKQMEFVTNTSRFSCYSGGFGSGKTYAGCVRGLVLSQFPNNFGLIGRLTYRELADTTRKTFFEVCPPDYYDSSRGGKWMPTDNYLRLVNGSEIIFRHMDTVSEKELLSLNLGWFYIDQAEEVGEGVFRTLQSRLRLNRVPTRYGFITCNPEPGNWIYKIFQKPNEEGTLNKDYYIVNSSTADNPYNPPDYLQSLIGAYPEEMQKRYIEGRWDAVENMIYTEFDRRIHVVHPFTPPKNWEYIVALDHGMTNPTAALLACLDFDGNIFIIDEYYCPGIVSDHARAVHKMTAPYEISFWLIDPATQAKTREKEGQLWSVLEEYQDHGLYFTPANNEKLAGINRVKEFLRPQVHRRHPVTHNTPAPKLYFFQNVVNTLDEIQQYKWKKLRGAAMRNLPEQAVDFNDHAMDTLRYIIMSRFPPPNRRHSGLGLVSPQERKASNIITEQMPEGYQSDGELGMFEESSLISSSPLE